ncbi:MAG TPA: D-aminoacyl-tRNA deacylase, partial [Anaerolineaceae bacterium]
MRALIQRAAHGRVTIAGRTAAEIGRGLVILLGVGPADTEEQARFLADKIIHLRIFEDAQEKMNLS